MSFPSSALEYCNEMVRVLQETQVTDRQGGPLKLDQGVSVVIDRLKNVRERHGKVLVIGNGGSAAIAIHLQNDLCKSLRIRALTFYDTSLFSAIANDDGAGAVFETPVQLFAESRDLLIAISSSGRSENILRAVHAAIERGCDIITLSGFRSDNPLRQLGSINFFVGIERYGLVELCHQILVHGITDLATIAFK